MYFRLRIASLLLKVCTNGYSQAPKPQPITPKPTPTKTNDCEALTGRERREQARSLLIAFLVDARTFRDQSLRARALARIADAVWRVDPEQSRSMFQKAWESAEVSDQESERKPKEEVERQKARTGGGFAITLR